MDDEFAESAGQPPAIEVGAAPDRDSGGGRTDRAAAAVEALKARIAARANMDSRLAEVEAALGAVQRQSMSLSTGADEMERVKDVIRKQSAAINEMKRSLTALEGVCRHLVEENATQQKDLAALNAALCRLADED